MNKLRKLLLRCEYCNKTTADVDYVATDILPPNEVALIKALWCKKCRQKYKNLIKIAIKSKKKELRDE